MKTLAFTLIPFRKVCRMPRTRVGLESAGRGGNSPFAAGRRQDTSGLAVRREAAMLCRAADPAFDIRRMGMCTGLPGRRTRRGQNHF